jgi:hypothetical protein
MLPKRSVSKWNFSEDGDLRTKSLKSHRVTIVDGATIRIVNDDGALVMGVIVEVHVSSDGAQVRHLIDPYPGFSGKPKTYELGRLVPSPYGPEGSGD